MATNPTRLLIGSTPVDLLDLDDPADFTHVHSRPARMFTLESLRNDTVLGEVHLGVGAPGQFGPGPLIELMSGDPAFFEQLAEAAAQTARSMRALADETAGA